MHRVVMMYYYAREEDEDIAATSGSSIRLVQDFAIVCLVCRHRFGNRRAVAHPTNAKMHKLICPSCIEDKALRRLYRDPEYKAAIIAMWDREKKKKEQLQAIALPSAPRHAATATIIA
ncbi:hypothetical protein NTE_00372 [Candidatus Nitrososphaera evergladensis SR1]|uniref:Uncharacterized protein n=1 Tax=Candidatus Nitrososphaera evergladensis SR1 TaxID=1459636 RepID=A0A075MSZ0_9ARCH|nr:hypothetical protein [Candidatus Nitrososphaera evergladensis]AIF82454.1 hypothetical protein NTE_00372 [Candidatus Nitrososphaera evergladensis SR1]